MRNFKFIKHILLFTLILIVSTSCERHSLIELDDCGVVTVKFNVDWSKYNASTPEKMTLICYPEGDGKPIVVVVDNPDQATAVLPPGNYKVYVVNDEIGDNSSYDIDLTPELVVSLIEGEEPLPLGVDEIEVVVPDPELNVDEDGNISVDDKVVVAPTLYPQNIVWTGKVTLNILGYDNVKALNGSLSGLAANVYGDGNATVTNNLNDWSVRNSDHSYVTTFTCLGLPKSHSFKPEDNVLNLNFTLNDGNTVTRDILVGNTVEVDQIGNKLNIEVAAAVVDQTAGGYDIEVEPWEEDNTN